MSLSIAPRQAAVIGITALFAVALATAYAVAETSPEVRPPGPRGSAFASRCGGGWRSLDAGCLLDDGKLDGLDDDDERWRALKIARTPSAVSFCDHWRLPESHRGDAAFALPVAGTVAPHLLC